MARIGPTWLAKNTPFSSKSADTGRLSSSFCAHSTVGAGAAKSAAEWQENGFRAVQPYGMSFIIAASQGQGVVWCPMQGRRAA